MMDDIILNKIENIERCVKRVQDTYHGNEKKLAADYDIQDIIVLNLQRACEASIDIAMHLLKTKKLGIPKDSREAFALLSKANIIPPTLFTSLANMVGFRNVIIHEYTEIDYNIVKNIVTKDMAALTQFTKILLKGNPS